MPERVICTTVTKDHLSQARTLAETLLEHNPNSTLYVLLADRLDGYFDPDLELFELIQLEDLPDQAAIAQMCFYYTPFELCCALRGWLHEYMLEQTDAESWIYLDANVMVCHSLEPIFQHLGSVSLLLTPQRRVPLAVEEVDPQELSFLRQGIHHSSFLGLRRSRETARFIQWFKQRLTYYCFDDLAIDHPRGLFVDQLWLNAALLYFRGIDFVTDPGVHWTVGEKPLKTAYDGTVTVERSPLLWLYFSDRDWQNPSCLGDGEFCSDPIWMELAETYREKLLDNDWEGSHQYPSAFAVFDNGDRIQLGMRRAYYEDVMRDYAIAAPFAQAATFQAQPYVIPTVAHLTAALAQQQRQVNQMQQVLEQTHQELHQSQEQRQYLQQQLARMERSKFWKLRTLWMRLKQFFKGSGSKV
jgi:hypothetical protein